MQRLKTLFVCSRNQWRSPTAERVYRNDQRLAVRSRGLSGQSVRQLRDDDLYWADVVFVMEEKHRSRMRSQYRDALHDCQLHVLEIPDDYRFMDPELIDLLQQRIEPCLQEILREHS